MTPKSAAGVSLPKGSSGSKFLYATLKSAVEAFPSELNSIEFPSNAGKFKAHYGKALARFEAARQASSQRVEIARHLTRETQAGLCFVEDGEHVPFSEYMATPAEPLELASKALPASPGHAVEIPFEGKTFAGEDVKSLIALMRGEHLLTKAAADAVCWTMEHVVGGEGIHLKGRRFALLGAGAELAPTRMLLAAGADVLWIDVRPPPTELLEAADLAGRIFFPKVPGDLLQRPREIRATIVAFANGQPVDIGMFAYAGGASLEWRLGAAMNGIVRGLDPDIVGSLSMWISPTTVAAVQPEDVAASRTRRTAGPNWHGALAKAGMLPSPGFVTCGEAHVTHGIVPIQGVSYQATQYISKIIAAEVYAVCGLDLDAKQSQPVTVSANVAGITRTRSMQQPVFETAFIGAPSFGVQIFTPETTRIMSMLLMCHDLLNPASPSRSGVLENDPIAKVAALHSRQVHGGIYGLPYELYPAIRAAALLGICKRPSMLPALFK